MQTNVGKPLPRDKHYLLINMDLFNLIEVEQFIIYQSIPEAYVHHVLPCISSIK